MVHSSRVPLPLDTFDRVWTDANRPFEGHSFAVSSEGINGSMPPLEQYERLQQPTDAEPRKSWRGANR